MYYALLEYRPHSGYIGILDVFQAEPAAARHITVAVSTYTTAQSMPPQADQFEEVSYLTNAGLTLF